MNIGCILKELRIMKNATQQQIARKLNIERSTYAKWEIGSVMLKVDQLQNVAEIYGIEFEWIARCIGTEKIIFRKDFERCMHINELKEATREKEDI